MKILESPLMFSEADVLLVNKTDYLPEDGFVVGKLCKRAAVLNPKLEIFELFSKTGAGFDQWVAYLKNFLK